MKLAAAAIASNCFAQSPEVPNRSASRVVRERIARAADATRVERTVRALAGFGTRSTLSAQDDPARGIGAAREWLAGELRAVSKENGGRLRVELQPFLQATGGRIPKPVTITNVVATLEGSLPEGSRKTFVVCAHYDSIPSRPTDGESDAPGANDDASGCAVALEAARLLAPHRFKHTLVFLLVAGEEQGLLGSRRYAELAARAGTRIGGMITNDIVGNTLGQNGVRDRGSIRLFSEGVPSDETAGEASRRRIVGGENDSSSRQLARFMAEAAKGAAGLRVHQVWRRDRFGRGGDHIPFLEAGWPAVRLTEPNEDYRRQHQNVRTENGVDYGDLPDLVDFDYVARVARLNALALAALASAPSPPTRVRIAPGLSPDTMLQWAPSDDPDVTGYEVVWRPTTAPDWSLRRKAGKVATLTLNGVSKDDFQFGVRSVDRHGNRSVVAAAGSR